MDLRVRQPTRSERRALHVVTGSAEETEALGRTLGQIIDRGTVIALNGELGAGKTTFTRGVARGLGIEERVTSPTFTLVNQYRGREGAVRLIHVDSYRLEGDPRVIALQAQDIGLDELLDAVEEEGCVMVLVIEWADRLAALLPADRLEVTLHHVEGSQGRQRRVDVRASGPISSRILDAF